MLDGGEDRVAVGHDGSLEFDEGVDAAAPGPGDPLVEGFGCLVEWELEDDPESFLEVVGPGEVGVGSHDPVELDHLLAGQGVGVAQQRVSAALDAGGVGGVGPGGCVAAWPAAGAPGIVGLGLLADRGPCLAAHRVEGVGGPFDDVERVGAEDRIRAFPPDGIGDPARAVRGHVGDEGAPVLAQRIEECGERRGVAARRSPDQPPRSVVHHDGEVLVAPLVADLVDPDPGQVREPVEQALGVVPDPFDDRPDRPPRHPHQLSDRGLGRLRRQPRHLLVERASMASVVASPRNGCHDHAMIPALHPRRIGLHEHLDRTKVQRPPPAPARARVVRRATPRALPAPVPLPLRRPHRRDEHAPVLVELHALDHRVLEPEEPTP